MNHYCYLTVRGGKVIIECAYDAQFVEKIKAMIPSWERTWRPETKEWVVTDEYLNRVKELACQHYDRVWLLEGGITTDLKTGETVNPMFDPTLEAEV